MLNLSGTTAVLCTNGPTILVDVDRVGMLDNDGLDGKGLIYNEFELTEGCNILVLMIPG